MAKRKQATAGTQPARDSYIEASKRRKGGATEHYRSGSRHPVLSNGLIKKKVPPGGRAISMTAIPFTTFDSLI